MEEPYLGPRPFDEEHRNRFFGRDDETEEILSLILSHNTILVYAQSGAGKTSIFNAQILPSLKERGYEILPIARVKIASTIPITLVGSSGSLSEDLNFSRPEIVPNIYVFNAMHSMKPKIESTEIIAKSLPHFLKEYFPAKKDQYGRNQPQILVFDQFEELFSVGTKDYRNRQEEFFKQIVEALAQIPGLVMAFVMREEYIARLQPFIAILPDQLRYRFRLERLKKDNAFAAVKKPLIKLNLYHEELEEDINAIVENLKDEGEYIEPIHLQVVCQRWWRQRMSTAEGVQNIGIIDNIADLDRALEEFYVNVVHDATDRTNVSEADIRDWCENQLITSTETRGIVHQTPNSTAGMPNKVIEALDKGYLIRPEIRSGDVWYELTHDRLVKPIKNSNQKWRETERSRKSRRNKLVVLPSSALAGALITFFLLSLLWPHPAPQAFILGQTPSYLAANGPLNRIYVSNHDNNSISVIDGKTNKVIHNVPVGHIPSELSVLYNNMTNQILVSNHDNNSISVIDGKTYEVKKNIPLASIHLKVIPTIAAINPNTSMIYVASSNDTYGTADEMSITVINGTTDAVKSAIPLDYRPSILSINPKTNMIYVAGEDGVNYFLTIINGTTNEVMRNIPLDQNPFYISVSPNTNTIYIAGESYRENSTITVINGTINDIKRHIILNNEIDRPSLILINPITEVIYGLKYDTYSYNGFLTILDGKTNQVLGEDIPVNSSISPRLSLDPVTNIVYLVGKYVTSGRDFITAINGTSNKVIMKDLLRGNLLSPRLSLDPVTNIVYLVGKNVTSGRDFITAINGTSNKVIMKDLLRGNLLSPILYNASYIYPDPETNIVFLLGNNVTSGQNLITVINGTTNRVITKNVPTDMNLDSFSLNPMTNMIYLAGYNKSNEPSVSVIDGKANKIINNIPIGCQCNASDIILDVNPLTNMIYLASSGGYQDYNNTVSVINGTTNEVSVINGTTNEVIKAIPLEHHGGSPMNMYINRNTNMIYLAWSGGYPDYNNTVSVINGTTNEVIKAIPLDDPPVNLSVDPKRNIIYVSEENSTTYRNHVVGINGTTNKPFTNIPINNTITYLKVNPKTNQLYAIGYNSTNDEGSISVIDDLNNKSKVESKFPHGQIPMFVNPETNLIYLYVRNSSPDTSSISVMNGTTSKVVANNISTLTRGILNNGQVLIGNPNTNMLYLTGYNSTSDSGSITIIDGKTRKQITNVSLDGRPSFLFVDPKTSKIYAGSYNYITGTGSSVVLDGLTNKVNGHINLKGFAVSQTPSFISVNNNTNMIYVSGFNSTERVGSIYIINGTSDEVKETILLRNYAPHEAVNPITNTIYVAEGPSDYSQYNPPYLHVINGKTNKVGAPIPLEDSPLFVSVNPKSNLIYVVGPNSITVIDGTKDRVESVIPFNAAGVSSMWVNPKTNMLIALDSDSLLVINGTTDEIDSDVTVDKNVFGLAIIPETNKIYVSDLDSNTVYAINGSDYRKDQSIFGPNPQMLRIGKAPSDIFFNPKINTIYAMSPESVFAINASTGKIMANIRAERTSPLLINPVTNMIYIGGTNSSGNAVKGNESGIITVINGTTNKFYKTILLDQKPLNMSVNPKTNMIYVTSVNSNYVGYNNGIIHVIDGSTNKVIKNITLDGSPTNLHVNPKTNMVYVVTESSGYYTQNSSTLTVIDGTRNDSQISLDLNQTKINDFYVDPKTSIIYVAGFRDYPDYKSIISVINGTTNKEISEYSLTGNIYKIIPNPVTNSTYILGDSRYITVINNTINKIADQIKLDKPLSKDSDLAIDQTTNMIYVLISDPYSISNLESKSVTLINGNTDKVIDEFPLANIGSADAIDINPLTHTIYVASKSSESVTAINARTGKILTNFNK